MSDCSGTAFCVPISTASQDALTRREQAILDAVDSGQNIEAVVRREQAIGQAENERKMRLLEFAG